MLLMAENRIFLSLVWVKNSIASAAHTVWVCPTFIDSSQTVITETFEREVQV